MDIPVGHVPYYRNGHLQEATIEILELGASIRNNLFRVANIIASVSDSECYKSDGFDTVHQWTAKAFGFKKTASYTLLRIGQEWTMHSDELQCYKSNLTGSGAYKDFSTTQIEKMLPVGHDTAYNLVCKGKLLPEMTVREIGKVIKEYMKEDESEDGGEDIEDESEDGGEDIEDEVKEVEESKFVRVIDEKWMEYLIPTNVLKEYATGKNAKGIIRMQ